jgi:malonyl-CoA O-methyltransferase
VDKAFSELDHALVRRHFTRAAPTFADAAVLAREIERRMLERLDYVKIDPRSIVDAGCGLGAGLRELGLRYPAAQRIGVDAAASMLHGARDALTLKQRVRAYFGGNGAQLVCADMRAMPLGDAACDMVWSNFGLAFAGEPQAALREFARVLKPGGLLMFSAYGPDTLRELRAAFAAADVHPHVHDFTDMHDLGDMLSASGFATPVMDMEMITLTYADVAALARDLRASGQSNALASRHRGLSGKHAWRRMLAAYERSRDGDGGRIPASFEVVYGHAWKGAPRTPGVSVVKVDLPRLRKGL